MRSNQNHFSQELHNSPKEIARCIRRQQADYILTLKGNQGRLYDNVVLYLEAAIGNGFKGFDYDACETIDKGRGHLETRRHWVTGDIDWLRQHHPDWCDLNSIGVVQSIRQVGEAKSVERRFYISSREPDASYFAKAVCQHWGIENQLHWLLDVTFDEDQCPVRTGYAPENFSILRRMALNMLKQETSRLSLKAKRRKAGWDFGFLCKILKDNRF